MQFSHGFAINNCLIGKYVLVWTTVLITGFKTLASTVLVGALKSIESLLANPC